MLEVNSKDYWDYRFKTDWIERLGRLQSAFFASQAISVFPEWLLNQINDNKWHICDWGCALGDGTNELFKSFNQSPITGIDFSDIAIENAKINYPQISFQCKDLLEEKDAEKFDLLFSSNVLEHFSNPWEVLSILQHAAKEHLIIIIPYKEFDRHEEHCYTFEETNIPVKINDAFHLSCFEILDTGKCQPNYWGGLQALLIYSNIETIEKYGLPQLTPECLLETDNQFLMETQIQE